MVGDFLLISFVQFWPKSLLYFGRPWHLPKSLLYFRRSRYIYKLLNRSVYHLIETGFFSKQVSGFGNFVNHRQLLVCSPCQPNTEIVTRCNILRFCSRHLFCIFFDNDTSTNFDSDGPIACLKHLPFL